MPHAYHVSAASESVFLMKNAPDAANDVAKDAEVFLIPANFLSGWVSTDRVLCPITGLKDPSQT